MDILRSRIQDSDVKFTKINNLIILEPHYLIVVDVSIVDVVAVVVVVVAARLVFDFDTFIVFIVLVNFDVSDGQIRGSISRLNFVNFSAFADHNLQARVDEEDVVAVRTFDRDSRWRIPG